MRLHGSAFICTTLGLALAACSSGGGSTSSTTAGSVAGSGSAAGSSSGGPTSSGSASGAGPTTSGTGGATSSSGGASSTGGAPVFVDGGYVFCSMAFAADAGPDGDGGPANWLCPPGTYVCDLSGNIGNCFQCQSDSDCANPGLPTYDPARPHCDLTSGVPGYQNHCQQCTKNGDCTGNPAGSFCDSSPTYPANASQPPIVDLGFETCGALITDCRIDGGAVCGAVNQYCDQATGWCLTRSTSCTSDDECIGVLSPFAANTPEPYCVDGGCNSCPNGQCFNAFCNSDANCVGGTTCDLTNFRCVCTDSSQCGGLTPVCEVNPNFVDDAGDPLSICSCDSNDQCGDGGLVCIPGTSFAAAQCGVPCTAPGFPSCRTATYLYPICNPSTGLCGPCTNDNQCRDGYGTGGPLCDVTAGGPGNCGCLLDSDCAPGETCQTGTFLGVCNAALSGCTPGSCNGLFCDWDAGACLTSLNPKGLPSCFTDYDCGVTNALGSICQNGQCIQCLDNADCVRTGKSAAGLSKCCLPGSQACATQNFANNTCEFACDTNQDCVGNPSGPSCVVGDGGYGPKCGCASDQDCAGSAFGGHCNLEDPTQYNYGTCNCVANTDCAPGVACPIFSGVDYGYCSNFCFPGVDGGPSTGCLDGYFCDPNYTCRPRCDNGNQCQGEDSLCDTQNVGGENDKDVDGTAIGTIWCYACLQASDCGGAQGCDPPKGCDTCLNSLECPSGMACIDGGICQPTCGSGSCPQGMVCDTGGIAGYGANVCYACVTAADCPNGEGCNSQTHACGSCFGPTKSGGPYDCPPDAICSNYWSPLGSYTPGVCLTNCDRQSCPAAAPICAVYPGLTPDHRYCFSCLHDSDCGTGQYCNLSPNPTFTCMPLPGQ